MDKLPKSVLIFRKRMLPYSETFIADQGRYLSHFTPCFAGFTHDPSGQSYIVDYPSIILEDYAGSFNWAKLKHRLGLTASRAWLDAMQETSPALIHAHFAIDAIDAMDLSRQLDIPFLATVHGFDITHSGESSYYRKRRDKMFQQAGKIIAVSNYIKQKLLEKGCPEEKIVQHYIGIDVEKFTVEKAESTEPSILFIGRLVEKKGCIYLMDAVEKIGERYPGLAVNIVGTGPLEKELRNKANKLPVAVNFLGKQTPKQIKGLMSSAWVFCTPSITAQNGDAEGLGMVFLEAQSMKTPAVSFGSGGVVEAIAHGETGLLATERDADGLAESLDFFLSSQSHREEYGNKGRQRVLRNFNIREQCKTLESIYQGIVG
ncbi:MAG: glycosyltransferase [Gammaproteobacteria bacterium]|nr:glycosyltransferase [Gammaproteobacteria bacterium]